MKKFELIEKLNFENIEIHLFEVKMKPYLMVRFYRNQIYVGEFFSSPEKWGFKAEMKIKKLKKGS